MGADGHLYSTSRSFSLIVPRARGTVFRVSLAGDAEVLHRFFESSPFNVPPGISRAPEGGIPEGELAEGLDGEFYGASSTLGPSVTGRGTIFRIQPDGTLAVLYAFSQGPNQTYPEGANPRAGLILGADGYIYGTTAAGGANGNGTIFRISGNGGLATLRSFAQDGLAPTKGRLLETAPGVFYGTAPSASGGVVYQLQVGADTLLAESRFWATNEDESLNGVLTATGAGPSATFSLLTDGRLGVVTVDPATGAFTYTPNPNANGPDSFTFSVTDGILHSNISTVTVNVVPVNDPPVAIDSSVTHGREHTRTGDAQRQRSGRYDSAIRPEQQSEQGDRAADKRVRVGAFDWQVSGPAATTAFIRVMSLSTGASDVNNRPFAIVAPQLARDITQSNRHAHAQSAAARAVTSIHHGLVKRAAPSTMARHTWTRVSAPNARPVVMM